MLIRFAIFGLILSLQTSANVQQPPATANPDLPGTCVVLQRLRIEAGLLEMAHLPLDDEQKAAKTIADFFQTFRAYSLGLDRNAVTRQDFIVMRDDLVTKTRRELEKELTKDGWQRLDKFIRGQIEHPSAPSRRRANPPVMVT
jgi:hypothetical protein